MVCLIASFKLSCEITIGSFLDIVGILEKSSPDLAIILNFAYNQNLKR